MRKTKQVIDGTIRFYTSKGEDIETNLESLGSCLRPSFGGLMDGKLVNDRMMVIELQQQGIKLAKIFHYRSSSEKTKILEEWMKECCENLVQYLEEAYSITHMNCSLYFRQVYDEDYCGLSIEEAKADLTNSELQEVIAELATYKPTVICKREVTNVFFD